MADQMDDPSIKNDDELLRRIHPLFWVQEANGSFRMSSGAFKNTTNTNEMSVDLRKKLNTPLDSLKDYPNYGLACFTAGLARKLNQIVYLDPIAENIAHATVCGEKKHSICQKFAAGSSMLKQPVKT